MKKFSLIILFVLGFFVVFALSAVITFTLTLDRDEEKVEAVTEDSYTGGSILPQGNVIEAETTVTRVTPTLTVADAIIVHGIYGEDENVYEKPSLDYDAFDEEDAAEDKVLEEDEAFEDNANADEVPKTEVKKEEVKTETPKVEEKKEEVKAEEKPAAEEKAEEVKAEEVKEEEKPQVVLDPNKQYSDTGI